MGCRGLAAGFMAVALLLGGCSASSGPSGDSWPATCDGGPSMGDRERVLRALLDAAGRADADLACTVVTGTPPDMDLGRELEVLKGELYTRGITPGNALLEDLSEAGPSHRYLVTGPAETGLEPIELVLVQQQDTGYRVLFPVPEHGYL